MSLSTNYKFKITVFTGIVNRVDKTVKSRVISIGGGGWVGPNGGYVPAATTHTEITIDHDVWISVEGEAKEKLIQFTTDELGIPLKENQRVSVFILHNETIDRSYNIGLFNHDIEKYDSIGVGEELQDCVIEPDISILKNLFLVYFPTIAIPLWIGIGSPKEPVAGMIAFILMILIFPPLHSYAQIFLAKVRGRNKRALGARIKENAQYVVSKISSGSNVEQSTTSFDYDWRGVDSLGGIWAGIGGAITGSARWLAYLLAPIITGIVIFSSLFAIDKIFHSLYSILVFFQIPILTWIISTIYLWRRIYRSLH